MKLTDITHGVIDRPPRILLCGVSKIGKSTFAAGAPKPIFLPIKGEEGIDALDVARFPTAESFDDMMESLGELAENEHVFETVVIDSLSTLQPLIWAKTCIGGGKKGEDVASIEGVGGGWGKGYIEALNYWRQLLSTLDYLRAERNMGCVLISHVVVKAFSDPGGENYDTWEMDLHKSAVATIERWSDAILFANSKVFTKVTDAGSKVVTEKGPKVRKAIASPGGGHMLFTQKRPYHPGGGRGAMGQVPYEMDLDYGVWANAVQTAAKGE